MVFLVLAACTGQQNKNNKASHMVLSENKYPEFEFTEEIHNFGTRKSGEILDYTFVYRNSGEGVLEIKKIESGCGCLRIEPGSKILQPGETGKIRVVFDTSGLWGDQFQSFRVLSNRDGIKMDLAVAAKVVNDNIQLK